MFDAERENQDPPLPQRDHLQVGTWRRRAIMYIGRASRHWFSGVIARYSRIGNPPIFSADTFAWLAPLERNWRTIRAEATRVLAERQSVPPLVNISPDHKGIADTKWKSFFLWGYGYRIDENCARCPETAALLAQVPGLISAFYSIIEPGGRLVPHRGVTKAFFTCHLALQVPREAENAG
jgi:beta-hydroxylase